MALMDFIKKQFIDIIQWTETGDGTLAWRFPMQDMEIQNGASLTVRESQLAVFVNEGQVADVFGPGMHKLSTQTLPVLTYLKNWDKLFESPFKSDVYFFSTRQQIDQKWGTPQPITIRDADFGAVRLRAFGNYSYRVVQPALNRLAAQTRESFSVAVLEGDSVVVVARAAPQPDGISSTMTSRAGCALVFMNERHMDMLTRTISSATVLSFVIGVGVWMDHREDWFKDVKIRLIPSPRVITLLIGLLLL